MAVSDKELQKRARWRNLKDKSANWIIGLGGIFVIVAIALIFFYLVFEVKPLFTSAEFKSEHTYSQSATAVNFVDVDEYNQTGMRLTANKKMDFFSVADGQIMGSAPLPIPQDVNVISVQRAQITSNTYALGLSNGEVLVFKPNYAISYDDQNKRKIMPEVQYPFGQQPLLVDNAKQALNVFALQVTEQKLTILAVDQGHLSLMEFSPEQAVAAEGMSLGLGEDDAATEKKLVRTQTKVLEYPASDIRGIVFGQDAKWGYVLSAANTLAVFHLTDEVPQLYQQVSLLSGNKRVTQLVALQGNISLLVGDSSGDISQWFLVRAANSDVDKFNLTFVRKFHLGGEITALTPELKRKGFMAGNDKGQLGYFFSTSERTIGVYDVAKTPVRSIAVSNRSEGVYVQSQDGAGFWNLNIKHPDISMQSLWGKVWYESYPHPDYVWQSTSGNSDFEGKLSLMPLTFGTLKAAFYAMILAAPLAICGAMYTAVFMAPGLRRKVKPTIELMQALPTVILGFLAGLWLAPQIEANLPGIFSLLIVTPIVILLCGFLYSQLSIEKRSYLPDGWAPVVLIIPILITGWLSFYFSQPIEILFFGGDIRHWLEGSTGLNFDQRNALIVGLTMGFAIIAPIFSIAEDALFAVPRHLTNGSLALGATQWQTLVRVVLPTASPGIFSAVMIGFGRAIGETMIVLMATGNTAVMDWNIFEGMRTLSANVAVEMGEAEVGSTHFRILFLSALVLFVITFVLNTIAEIVRTRLRKKYGSL